MPATGAAIIASNHLSFSDSIFMPLMVQRRVTFVAKAEYFTGKGHQGLADQDVLRRHRHHPGRPLRRPGRPGRHGHRPAGAAATGELFGIYPEGTRSPDGRLYRGKTGVARLALESRRAGDPGGDAQRRRDPADRARSCPRSSGSRSASAPPLDFSRYAGLAGDRFVERAVTDEIMYELMELSGREYVDVYAPEGQERARSAVDRDRLASQLVG